MRHFSTAAATAFALLANSSSNAAPLETIEKTISVPLDARGQVTTSEAYPANSVAWPCPLNTRGSAPNPATPGFLRVGWSHGFDAGTPPFACQYRINHVERVIIAPPPLGELRSKSPRMFVKSARLSFDKKRIAGDHDCGDKFFAVVPGEAAIPPQIVENFEIIVPKLGSAGCVGSRCTIEVRGQVDQWVRGPEGGEMGLALIGDQERLDANDNVSCVTDYANFKLDIDFKFDAEKSGLVVPILKGGLLKPLINLSVVFVRRTTDELLYDLKWNVISDTGRMDIVRDDVIVQTVADRGQQRDRAPFGPHRYKVCVAGTSNCSNVVSVND